MERRRDALSGEWRLFSTHRQDRTYKPTADACPLCPTRPGPTAAQTEVPQPAYQIVVFDNRFPALAADPPPPSAAGSLLQPVAPALGAAEVVLYSDRHDVTFAGLDPERVRRLVDVWADRYAVLGARPEVTYVFAFENKGAAVGVTLEHPHGQIYGFPEVPPRFRHELGVAAAHLAEHGSCLQCDVLALEHADGARVVAADEHAVAYVPFAARLPYEVHVVPRLHAGALPGLGAGERRSLAGLLLQVTGAYDALFGFPLPYVMALHQAPTDGGDWSGTAHLRVEFSPLHRSADRLKYLAGAELAAGAFLNDVAPEAAAAALRGEP